MGFNRNIDTQYPMRPLEYGTDEYSAAIRNHDPVRAPLFWPGQLVYDGFHGANVPVCSVSWDRGSGRLDSFWRVCTPGHSAKDIDFCPAMATAKTYCYRETGPNSWTKVAEVQGSESND